MTDASGTQRSSQRLRGDDYVTMTVGAYTEWQARLTHAEALVRRLQKVAMAAAEYAEEGESRLNAMLDALDEWQVDPVGARLVEEHRALAELENAATLVRTLYHREFTRTIDTALEVMFDKLAAVVRARRDAK